MMDLIPMIVFVYYVYLLITGVYLLLDNRDPGITMAWLIIFGVFPVVGFVCYLFFGCNKRWIKTTECSEMQFIKNKIEKVLKPIVDRQKEYIDILNENEKPVYKGELIKLLYKSSASLLTLNNDVTIFYGGEEKFKSLKNDLMNAKQFIHLEYFIWCKDALTSEIIEILIEKIEEGVEVRILYDFWGGFSLKKSYIKNLRDKGICIYPFFNFLSLFRMHTANYRNHRKIAIIDGLVGYTGGMNASEEYISGGKNFSHWRDAHLRIEGEIVQVLQSIFLTDWENTTKEMLFQEKYFPVLEKEYKKSPMQVAVSGPDSPWRSIQQMYFTLIKSAEKNVFIQSPYFVPDISICETLKIAALCGVDVRILITGQVDKYFPYWAAFTYFEDLLKSGVKIYHYDTGFLHAKVVSIDGMVCSVGTANMDMRSFNINYELQTIMYDEDMTRGVDDRFLEDLKISKPFTLESYAKISYFKKVRNSIVRLFAPLL